MFSYANEGTGWLNMYTNYQHLTVYLYLICHCCYLHLGDYVFCSVHLSFCCLSFYFFWLLAILLKKSCKMVAMTFYGVVWGGKRNRWLNFWWWSRSPCRLSNQKSEHISTQLLQANFDEIFRIALQFCKEKLIKFWGWPGSLCWLFKVWIWAI